MHDVLDVGAHLHLVHHHHAKHLGQLGSCTSSSMPPMGNCAIPKVNGLLAHVVVTLGVLQWEVVWQPSTLELLQKEQDMYLHPQPPPPQVWQEGPHTHSPP